ncbi:MULTISPECIES: YceI family protein [unclassified Cellulomonas]|uniref:YceI family protein n=1 Tax=unclassified Cellulomonas TaxID=2620175 RepID=UPI00198BB0AE|nr:YceI family protein [Cellulomonas sp. ES6]MBD3779872.1 polyisoprenoid-binding protein [Micrococcales bacterium]WHP19200.1 YceI family protein [Cellulomonas sp. ES6]
MSVTTLPTGLTAGTWTLDPSHTEASFTVRHAGISKVRGTVAVTSGAITVAEDLTLSAVTATLDPTTINTNDAGRDGHLKSADFFDVETFGEWTFTSTAVRPDGDDYVVTGDLTIHGVTQSVDLAVEFGGAATDPFGNQRAGFSATTTISRKDFGITWNAALEAGGVLVSDKVVISLEVSAIKQA